MLHQRKHRLKRGLLAVDRVDDRLAGIYPQRCFQCCRIRGIELKGQVGHLQDRADRLRQHCSLVYARGADIDIQNIRAGIGLRDRFAAQIIHIHIQKRLLHALFSRRVDAFPDDTRHIEPHCASTGTDRQRRVDIPVQSPVIGQHVFHGSNKRRRRAAAAAEDLNAAVRKFGHIRGKFLRRNVIFPGNGIRQTGIRLCNQRKSRPDGEFLYQRQDFLRAE